MADTPFSKIYLDNNATTPMPPAVVAEMNQWSNQGNPSAGYESAERCRRMMTNFRQYIGEITNVNVCCEEDRDGDPAANYQRRRDSSLYKVIITSGASEANSAAITGIIDARNAKRNTLSPLPNIVMSTIEHKSVIKCVESLVEQGRATVTRVNPDARGVVDPEEIARAISPQTCLVCVMAANNEIGAINDIGAIGSVCLRRRVHYHCDAVQIFGKYPPKAICADSMSISFHKLHGPPGVGILLMRQSSDWEPIIHGSQNENLRGGTENIPGIAAAYLATRYTMHNRGAKNAHMLQLKRYLVGELAKRFHLCSYVQYCMMNAQNAAFEQTGYSVHDMLPQVAARALVDVGLASPKLKGVRMPNTMIVTISTAQQCLPNTLLLSVVRRTAPAVCNVTMKKQLENEGIIVSVGSACNTADAKASHVLYALGADQYVRQGCLRVSMKDDTTQQEIDRFIHSFSRIVQAVKDM